MKRFIQILILYLIIFAASLIKVFGQCTPNSIEFLGADRIYNTACGDASYQDIRALTTPIGKDYTITQQVSQPGLNFTAIHTMIHQVKSWIRTIFSWVSKRNIERYLNEFSYRTNRSQTKQTIFHNLIKRMVNTENYMFKILYDVKCSPL